MILLFNYYFLSSLNTETTYSAIAQSCSSVPPPTPIPPTILPFANNGYPPAASVILLSFVGLT